MRVLVCGVAPAPGVWDAWLARVNPTTILVGGVMPDWFGSLSRLPAIVHSYRDYTFEEVCAQGRPDLVLLFAPQQITFSAHTPMAPVPVLHVWGPAKEDCRVVR